MGSHTIVAVAAVAAAAAAVAAAAAAVAVAAAIFPLVPRPGSSHAASVGILAVEACARAAADCSSSCLTAAFR